jgi:pyruvate dehydrogenase E1 component alpha subunit
LARALEASAIGSLMELRAGDAIASEMSFAARMFAGQPLGLYFAEIYGVRSEYLAFAPEAASTPIHLLPIAETFAAQLNVAAGFALALKKAQRRNVVLVLLPDGANALGYWHEAARLAAAERLPMIFVAISSSTRANSFGDSDARQRAASYSIPGITVDGGDVVATWRVAQESIYRARGGAGPTLIDSQLPTTQSDSRQHAGSDPLSRMQHYLEKRKLWKQSWKGELTRRFAAEIDEAQSFFPRAGKTQ